VAGFEDPDADGGRCFAEEWRLLEGNHLARVRQKSQWTRRRGLQFWLVTIVVWGIFFRFANLGHKVFWEDEAFTALRISGYTHREVVENLYVTGQSVTYAEIQKYLSPTSDKDLGDMLQGLAIEDPHVPVLYFVLVRFWAQCFGGSIAVLRSLSAVFGLLCLPAFYGLCWELFRSRLAAGMGLALIAVSPFHVLYSQEARSYSLWTLVTLLSSTLLLRSLRQPKPVHWLLYALSNAVGIYSHLFYFFVAFSHGLYGGMRRLQLSRRALLTYGLTTAVGLSAFVPWAIVLYGNRVQAEAMMLTAWRGVRFSLVNLLAMAAGNISRLFFDIGLGSQDSFWAVLPVLPILLGAIALVIYSVWFLIRQAPSQVGVFILLLMGTSMVFFLISDLVIGGKFSGMPRYSIAMMIGIQLAVAYTLALQLPRLEKQFGWKLLIGVVFCLNLFSCAVSLPEKVWWHKGPQMTRYIPQVAALINQVPNPWVITDLGFVNIPAIAYELRPDIRIQLVLKGTVPEIPGGDTGTGALHDRSIFIVQPSPALLQGLGTKGILAPIADTGNTLYRLEPFAQ
jgi:uncharacterized membrane protein